MYTFSFQISSSITPNKSAIPTKSTTRNSIGVTRRNTFGYGDSKASPGDRATTPGNKSSVSSAGKTDLRRLVQ